MEKRTNSPYPRDRPAGHGGDRGRAGHRHGALHLERPRARLALLPVEFRRMVAEKFGEEKATRCPAGLQQIWVADLAARRPLHHVPPGDVLEGLRDAEQPFRTHPPEPLKTHPIEDYGCTSCHGGQGWAIDTAAAHGEVAHWEEPLLSRSLGEAYTLAGNKNALMQMNCNTCHRYDRETKGADAINLAKRWSARRAAAPAT